jgi:hypothetical protein
MQPMATSEYKPTIRPDEAILDTTGVGYELRKTINESRRKIDHSRQLMKETKIICERSRFIILASQRLTFKS